MLNRTLCLLALAMCCVAVWSCGRSGEDDAASNAPTEPQQTPTREVVLYTSADGYVADAVVEAYEELTGVDVLVLKDTEATKTVGLYYRLVDEAEAPRADVWWSSEPFYTVRLAEEGVLEPFTAAAAEQDFGGGWPSSVRAQDSTWYGFARRSRVIAYDTRKITEPPTTLRALAEPGYAGQVGMARPGFGTTAGHLAALVHIWGSGPTQSWLSAMEANGLRLYDSNSAVVQAIANGEISVGLTDSDDVWVGQERGWPIGLVYEASELAPGEPAAPGFVPPLASFGALSVPNTVAKIRGGPNGDEAAGLIEFLLSERGERLIMQSDSRNVPIRPDLAAELAAEHPETAIEQRAEPDLVGVSGALDEAGGIAKEVFGL